MMKRIETACVALMLLASMEVKSQDYKIPVLENDEPMATAEKNPKRSAPDRAAEVRNKRRKKYR